MTADHETKPTVIDRVRCLNGDHPWQAASDKTAQSPVGQQLTEDLTGWLGLPIALRECKVCGALQIGSEGDNCPTE